MEPNEEKPVFSGNPSLITCLGTMILSAISFIVIALGLVLLRDKFTQGWMWAVALAVLLIPVAIVLVRWIVLRSTVYEITSERIKLRRGIFSIRTDELELYRVKDTSLYEPLLYRMFSVGNILVVTADASTPAIDLIGIRNANAVREELRRAIEVCRDRKRTRMMEME